MVRFLMLGTLLSLNSFAGEAVLSPAASALIGQTGHGRLYQDGKLLMPVDQPCTLLRDTKEGHALKGEAFTLRDGNHESDWEKDFAAFRNDRLDKIDMGWGYLQRKVLRIGFVGEHGKNGLSDSSQIRLPGEGPGKPSRLFLSSSLTFEAAYTEQPVAKDGLNGWRICYADNGPKETAPWNYIEAGRNPAETCDGGDGLLSEDGKFCYNDGYWLNKRLRNTKWHTGIENQLDAALKPGAAGYCYEVLFGTAEVRLTAYDVGANGKTKETKKAICQL